MEPKFIIELIKKNILENIDLDEYNSRIATEKKRRKHLERALDKTQRAEGLKKKKAKKKRKKGAK